MDVVWMAKSFSIRLLISQSGQSIVEYILLLAVLSSLGYTVFNNKRFKDFLKGKDGMFATMKTGMGYSYRYGLEYNSSIEAEEKASYEYADNKHDTYLNPTLNESRFFTGTEAYPK